MKTILSHRLTQGALVAALGASTPVMVSFYFKPANCTGLLCTTLNPLTQN
ncbi:hypothetical protein J2785_000230 [Burkholderia ambifaria]|nr:MULTISPECIES: hypothetical protein [Burkholderia cepacia complex]MDR6497088.1 hypothetical protein [Burkholderia ambifaria]